MNIGCLLQSSLECPFQNVLNSRLQLYCPSSTAVRSSLQRDQPVEDVHVDVVEEVRRELDGERGV